MQQKLDANRCRRRKQGFWVRTHASAAVDTHSMNPIGMMRGVIGLSEKKKAGRGLSFPGAWLITYVQMTCGDRYDCGKGRREANGW